MAQQAHDRAKANPHLYELADDSAKGWGTCLATARKAKSPASKTSETGDAPAY